MNLPEIRIKDGWLLRENASQHLHELWDKNSKLADDKQMKAIVSSYNQSWKEYEQAILEKITSLLGVTFRKNILDVYVAPWFYAFSDPIVLGVTFTPEEFVDQLTHELIHVLLTDNNSKSIDSTNSPLGDEWIEMFGIDHTFTTLVHIPVHAIHKIVYLEVFKDLSRIENEIQNLTENNAQDYIKAWQYVEDNGEKMIVDLLRDQYRSKS